MQEYSYPSHLKKAFQLLDFFSQSYPLRDESANRCVQLCSIILLSRPRLKRYFANLRFIRKTDKMHTHDATKNKKEKNMQDVEYRRSAYPKYSFHFYEWIL